MMQSNYREAKHMLRAGVISCLCDTPFGENVRQKTMNRLRETAIAGAIVVVGSRVNTSMGADVKRNGEAVPGRMHRLADLGIPGNRILLDVNCSVFGYGKRFIIDPRPVS
jgi:hypothetical protein